MKTFRVFILSLLFMAFAVLSALLQGSDDALKKVVSPGLTTFCALIVLVGTLSGNVPLAQGLTVFIALLLLAASDTMFEQSAVKPELFPFPNPERRISWLSPYRILLAILVIYYPAQVAMVLWAS